MESADFSNKRKDDPVRHEANGNWLNCLWPLFCAAGGVAVYVAALHAGDILKP